MKTKKRYRRVIADPGELKVAFGRGDVPGDPPELVFAWGPGVGRHFATGLMDALRPMTSKLEGGGFDITTLKFSIQMKK